jgi:CheY-like chemotaxis protein
MRILYVEDDLRDADLTVRRLRKDAPSYEVEILPSVEAAMVRLRNPNSAPIDVVLTDVHLRNGDGLTLLNHIRESAILRRQAQ